MSKSPFYKTGISKSPLFKAGEYASTKRKQAARKGQKRLTGKEAEEAMSPVKMHTQDEHGNKQAHLSLDESTQLKQLKEIRDLDDSRQRIIDKLNQTPWDMPTSEDYDNFKIADERRKEMSESLKKGPKMMDGDISKKRRARRAAQMKEMEKKLNSMSIDENTIKPGMEKAYDKLSTKIDKHALKTTNLIRGRKYKS